MSLLYKLLLIFIFFLSKNVLIEAGINHRITDAVILTLSFLLLLLYTNSMGRKCKEVYLIIVAFIAYSFYKIYSDPSEGTRVLGLVLMLPVVTFGGLIYYEPSKQRSIRFWKDMSWILWGFYLVECGLAIIERIIQHNFFNWQLADGIQYYTIDIEDSAFRSFALIGHPLQNALIVSTIMSFILISRLHLKLKFILWGIGYLAILSFNTRSSMVGNVLILVVYILHEILYSKQYTKKQKNGMFTFLVSFIIIAFISVFVYGVGGRLREMGLYDEGSASVRVDIWKIFDVLPLQKFLLGFDFDQMERIMLGAGVEVTENFWIDYLLRYGLIFLSIFVMLYYILIKKLYQGYSRFHILLTFLAFILIASTNNSLSTGWHPIFIYLVCIVLFKPSFFNENKVHRKSVIKLVAQ